MVFELTLFTSESYKLKARTKLSYQSILNNFNDKIFLLMGEKHLLYLPKKPFTSIMKRFTLSSPSAISYKLFNNITYKFP